jgi:hypothetical protein
MTDKPEPGRLQEGAQPRPGRIILPTGPTPKGGTPPPSK